MSGKGDGSVVSRFVLLCLVHRLLGWCVSCCKPRVVVVTLRGMHENGERDGSVDVFLRCGRGGGRCRFAILGGA